MVALSHRYRCSAQPTGSTLSIDSVAIFDGNVQCLTHHLSLHKRTPLQLSGVGTYEENSFRPPPKNGTTAHTANWEEAGTGHGWYGVSTVGWKVCACVAVCVCARGLVCYHCSAVVELSRGISQASRAVGRTDMYDFR